MFLIKSTLSITQFFSIKEQKFLIKNYFINKYHQQQSNQLGYQKYIYLCFLLEKEYLYNKVALETQ